MELAQGFVLVATAVVCRRVLLLDAHPRPLTRLTLANPFGKLVQVPARLHDRRLQPIVPLLRRDSHGAFGDPTLELAQGFILVGAAPIALLSGEHLRSNLLRVQASLNELVSLLLGPLFGWGFRHRCPGLALPDSYSRFIQVVAGGGDLGLQFIGPLLRWRGHQGTPIDSAILCWALAVRGILIVFSTG